MLWNDIDLDDKLVKTMENLIDPTELQTVFNYVDMRGTGINGIIVVPKLEDLAPFAAFSSDANDGDGLTETIMTLVEKGVILFGDRDNDRKDDSTFIDLSDFNLLQLCRVIQMPPFFIIHMVDGKLYC